MTYSQVQNVVKGVAALSASILIAILVRDFWQWHNTSSLTREATQLMGIVLASIAVASLITVFLARKGPRWKYYKTVTATIGLVIYLSLGSFFWYDSGSKHLVRWSVNWTVMMAVGWAVLCVWQTYDVIREIRKAISNHGSQRETSPAIGKE